MRHKRSEKTEQTYELCPGVSVQPSVVNAQKDYNSSIFLKAVIVVLLTAGGIGSYLSAVQISYSVPVFMAFVIGQAILFALFYRSKKWENIGAILFFIIFLAAGMTFRLVINSGFYAVINETTDKLTTYFNTTAMRTYTERVTNRYLTVTAFAVTIAVVLEFLLFSSVLRSAGYVWCAILTVTVNLEMSYIRQTPSPVYMVMLVMGLALTAVLRYGGHYQLYRDRSGYAKTKRGFTYTVDTRMLAQIMTLTAAVVLVIGAGTAAITDMSTFDDRQPKSAMKADSEDEVKNALLLGFDGLFNRYQSKGGLSSGRLGGVSRVTQDGQPDLEITFTPYSQDTLYIRNFIGEQYNPVDNYWSVYQDEKDAGTSDEASALKKSYDENGKGARGVMMIKNVGADTRPYQPYYTTGGSRDLGPDATENVTYYPLFDLSDMQVSKKKKIDDDYLEVPSQDTAAVAAFCKEAGLTKGMSVDEAVRVLRDYFQKHYPYTLRPGATPRGKDFVEYFLTTNKKGYCAHFASSAVLILRYLGIPARYCEGYAVSIESLANNAQVENDLSYDDFYSGENELGTTAVIKSEASDLNAHAWVEVYRNGHGWTHEELTPAGSSDENGGGLLSDLLELFNGGGNSTDTTQQQADDGGDTGASGVSLGRLRGFFILLIVILALPALWFGLRRLRADMKYHRAFAHAGNSDRLILSYERHADRLRRRDIAFAKCINYDSQLTYLYPDMPSTDRARLLDILTRAGFSNHEISDEEYTWALKTQGRFHCLFS